MGPPQYTLTGAPVTQIKDILPKGQSLVDPNSVPSILNPTPTGKTITNVNLSESLGLADAAQSAAQRNAEREANLNQRSIVAPLLIAGEKYQPEVKRDSSGFASYFGFLPEASAQVQKKPINVNLAENLGVSESPRSAPTPRTVASDIFGAGGGFAELGGLDKDTINNVNSFVANSKADTIKITIGGQTKSYPIQQALNGIFSDVQNYKQQNPDAKNIPFSLSVATTKTTTVRPNVADSIKQQNQLASFINSAKGETITIKDKQGNVLGQTSGDRARYDILKASENGPVSLEYNKTISSGGSTTILAQNEKPAPGGVAGLFAGAEAEAKNIGGQFYALPGAISDIAQGKVSPVKDFFGFSIPAPKQPETAPSGLGSLFGSAESIAQGKGGKLTGSTGKGTAYDVGTYLVDIGLMAAPVGFAKGARSASSVITPALEKGVASKVASGIRENQAVYELTKVPESSTYQFFQGTVGKSEGVKPEIKPAESFLVRTGPSEIVKDLFGEEKNVPIGKGTVKSIVPTLPNTVRTIFGVGPKGEKVIARQEVQLPSPEGEVQAGIPQATIIPKGGTYLVKNNLGPFTENKILASNISPSLAKALGLEKVAGTKQTYQGQVTSDVLSTIEKNIKSKDVKPILDIYGFPTDDVKTAPQLYRYLTNNPKQFQSSKYSDVPRPSIIRYYEGKYTGSKPNEGRSIVQSIKSNKPFTPLTGGKFGIGETPEEKPQILSPQTETTLQEYFGMKTTPEVRPPRQDVLGPILTQEQRQQQRGRQVRESYGFEIISYPRGTSESLFGPQLTTTSGKGRQVGEQRLKGLGGLDITSRLKPETKETGKTRLGIFTDVFLSPKQSTSQSQETIPKQIVVPSSILSTEQTQSLEVPQRTTQETPTVLTEMFNVPKEPPLQLAEGGIFGLLPGGRSGNQKSGKKSRRSYILYSTNPNVVGDFYTKGLPEQGVSSSPSIFARGEKAIAKATRGYEASALVSTTIGKKRSARTQIKSIFESGPIQTPKRKKSKAYKSVLSY